MIDGWTADNLISREALKKAIEEQRKSKVYSEADERQNVIIDCILYIIDNAPTVEISGLPKIHYDRGFIAGYEKGKAERPHGEWIKQEQGAFYPIECSNCHNEPLCNDEGYLLSNFCPNCGAKMDGGEE